MKETKHTVVMTASEAAAHFAQAKFWKEKKDSFEAETGHTLGDYPNAANIREWMHLYFNRDARNIDLLCTLLYVKEELPEINTAADAIRFGLARGFSRTELGTKKAYDLGILSDDSPAVPIPVGASPKVDTPAASDTGKAGAMVDTDASPKADGNKHGKRKPKQGAVTGIAAKVGVSTWQGIRLEVDADIVRVNGEIDLTYGDLGIMRGARKGEPNRQRRLLILIAAASDKPYIPVDDTDYAGVRGLNRFSVHLTRLNDALQNAFGIGGNPVYLNDTGEVETLFQIQAAGADTTDKGGAAHVAKDKAAGRRKHQKFSTLAEADMAREAIEAKAREKSRY